MVELTLYKRLIYVDSAIVGKERESIELGESGFGEHLIVTHRK